MARVEIVDCLVRFLGEVYAGPEPLALSTLRSEQSVLRDATTLIRELKHERELLRQLLLNQPATLTQVLDEEVPICFFCDTEFDSFPLSADPERHPAKCPWRQAREWVQQVKEKEKHAE